MKKLLATLIAAVTVTFGGGLMAQQIGSVASGYIVEGNLMRPGNIIKTIAMSSREDANTCRAQCDRDAQCNAYTYLQEESGKPAQCLLRLVALPQGATRNHGHAQVASGTKVSSLQAVHRMTPYPARGFAGGTVMRQTVMTTEDVMQCARMCEQSGSCAGFTYFAKGTVKNKPGAAYCFAYSHIGGLQQNQTPGLFSASKKPVPVKLSRPVPSPTRTPSASPRLPQRALPRPTLVVPGQPSRDVDSATIPDKTLIDRAGGASDSDDVDNPEAFPGEMLDPPE